MAFQKVVLAGLAGLAVTGCQPTVRLQPPEEPIVINLNIKVEQEVRIKVEREVEELLKENPDLF